MMITVLISVIPTWLEVTVAVSTVIAAVAAALGAGAAWKAALASQATSADAREALAQAFKPEVWADFRWHGSGEGGPDEFTLEAWNQSKFDAVNVDMEVRRRDGRVFRTHIERLQAMDMGRPSPRHPLPAGEPPPVGGYILDYVERFTVRYSDVRGIGRWEYRRICIQQPGLNPPLNGDEWTEDERIR